MADIKKFAVEQTGRLHLRDAADQLMFADDGKTEPMVVVVYSPGSKQYAKAQAAQQNRLIDSLRRKGDSSRTPEQIAEEHAVYLSDCTHSFENIEYGDTPLDASKLFHAVYSDRELGFIVDQVAGYLKDWSNFTKASTKS